MHACHATMPSRRVKITVTGTRMGASAFRRRVSASASTLSWWL